MSHHIYHTSGFILGSSAVGEGSRAFRIFTRDLGLVRANAQGVRYQKSKLRYSLHDFSFCELSLVRGKERWRLTGASKQVDLFGELRGSAEMLAVFARVFSLLDRLLSGEEKNELLWSYLEEAAKFAVLKAQPLPLVRNFEYILVLRVLSSLGYLGTSPDTRVFVESPYWSDALLSDMDTVTPRILTEINRSIKASQL